MQTKTLLECCAVNALPSQGLARSLDDRRACLGFAVLDNDTFYSGVALSSERRLRTNGSEE